MKLFPTDHAIMQINPITCHLRKLYLSEFEEISPSVLLKMPVAMMPHIPQNRLIVEESQGSSILSLW